MLSKWVRRWSAHWTRVTERKGSEENQKFGGKYAPTCQSNNIRSRWRGSYSQ